MKVLLVDDSASCRMRVCKILKESGQDFSIYHAENGNEALLLIEENKGIDIILSDINMPEMDGITLLKILREKEQKEEKNPPPFIIYSTECSEELKSIAKSFKAAAWLLKPAKPNTIILALNQIFNPLKAHKS